MRLGLRALATGLGLALLACGDSGRAPPPPMGVPVAQEPPPDPFPEAPLTEDNRAQLGAVVAGFLIGSQERWGEGMIAAPGLADIIVPLEPGTDYRASFPLQGGRPYRFVGACDYECRNMDFELWDGNGVVVARDLMANDTPVMDYTPASGGTFTLRILMQTCTITPCYAGARTLTVQ